jgi:hypothetical protein
VATLFAKVLEPANLKATPAAVAAPHERAPAFAPVAADERDAAREHQGGAVVRRRSTWRPPPCDAVMMG